MKVLLVTGSSGLVGAEVCSHFAGVGYVVHGVDNNQRAVFFGPKTTRAGISGDSSESYVDSPTT